MKRYSVSQLNEFISCPEYYKRNRILKQKQSNYTDVSKLILGIAFDRYVSDSLVGSTKKHSFYFIQAILEKKDFLEYDKNNYLDLIGFEDNENFSEWVEKIKRNFKYNFFDNVNVKTIENGKTKVLPSFFQIYNNLITLFEEKKTELISGLRFSDIDIQRSFTMEFGDYQFTGIYDLISWNDEALPVIIDFKTSSKKASINDIIKLQDQVYTFSETLIDIPEFRYYYFIYSKTTGKVELQKFTIKHSWDSMENLKKDVINNIKSMELAFKNDCYIKNENSWICSKNYCKYYCDCQSHKNNIEIIEE